MIGESLFLKVSTIIKILFNGENNENWKSNLKRIRVISSLAIVGALTLFATFAQPLFGGNGNANPNNNGPAQNEVERGYAHHPSIFQFLIEPLKPILLRIVYVLHPPIRSQQPDLGRSRIVRDCSAHPPRSQRKGLRLDRACRPGHCPR